jgi:hypothetical protein
MALSRAAELFALEYFLDQSSRASNFTHHVRDAAPLGVEPFPSLLAEPLHGSFVLHNGGVVLLG